MRMPTVILASLSEEHLERWEKFYLRFSDRKRTQEEGIWRRTQTPENLSESGWSSPYDQRRRIVHYLHDFNIIQLNGQFNLVLDNVYLYYSISLPLKELEFTKDQISIGLAKGKWYNSEKHDDHSIWRRGDLICSITEWKIHPEDQKIQRTLPNNYRSLDVIVQTRKIGEVQRYLPWEVLAKGMRTKDKRGEPQYVNDLSILQELQPFHVEIGCGVSIEAGVPALHHLHDLYCVTDRDTNQFIFGGEKDTLIPRILGNPEFELPRLGTLFSAAFIAEPTHAHHALQLLSKNGYLIEPVMTNNFDGLAHRAGLAELFLRRYDETIPPVSFDSHARALLVIGSHADRRRVQARARARGLQIVFLDPEGYWVDSKFIPYFLEGPQDRDIICQQSATEGLTNLCNSLNIQL